MPTLKERILELVSVAPGITDTQLAATLQTSHQAVNGAARDLANRGQLLRPCERDGRIHNYLPTVGAGTPWHAGTSLTAASPHDDAPPKIQRDTVDIVPSLREYLSHRKLGTRYASFDYCFNYFQSHREQQRLAELLRGEALQLSCLQLGFYLASWGMFRGRAELLKRSARHLVPLIETIAKAPSAIWEIDAHLYGDGGCPVVFDVARRIRQALGGKASDILVTKIMLGVFGCVPAFDRYFKDGFSAIGVSKFGSKALRDVGRFYAANADAIEDGRVRTLDFDSGQETDRRYTRAKVIDMVFFVAGADQRAEPDVGPPGAARPRQR